MKEAANRGKGKTLLISAGMEIMLIICITAANLNPTPILYFIFYNLLYGLVFSLFIPLYCLYKENGVSVSGSVLTEAGFKKPGIRQGGGVLAAFVVFSVGGQLIPKMAVGEQIPWCLLPMGIVPLIMTTFFEEFLFRGFVQSRIDRQFGWVPAILVSGAMFSLYHLGYPGFRTWEDILLLFAVGAGFAAAYKLSGNNLMVSFFVNLPNAFVTYILKYEQFPVMRVSSTIAAAVTLVLTGLILLLISKYRSKEGGSEYVLCFTNKPSNEKNGWQRTDKGCKYPCKKGRNLWIFRAERSRENYGDEDGHESVEADGRDGGAFWRNP